MAVYESDHTRFMREWMALHPQEIEEQRSGRALWWDKTPATPDEQRRLAEATLGCSGYYYADE